MLNYIFSEEDCYAGEILLENEVPPGTTADQTGATVDKQAARYISRHT